MGIKRYIQKLACITLGFATCFGTVAYAQDTPPVITLEQAIRIAIERSNKIKVLKQEDSVIDVEQMVAANNAEFTGWATYDSLILKQKNNERMVGLIQDKIKYEVEKAFNEINVLEQEKVVLRKKVDVVAKDIKIMEIKNKSGLVNPIQYQASKTQLTEAQSSLALKEAEIDKQKNYVSSLIGYNINRFDFEDTINYEPFKIIGIVDAYIESKLDTVMWYDEQTLEVQKNNVVGDFPSADVYLRRKYNYIKGTYDLEDKEKAYTQQLRDLYKNLTDMEEQINVLSSQLEVLDQKLKVSEKYLEAGKMSAHEYDKQLLEKEELDLQIRKLKSNYFATKGGIERPWVILM